MKLNLNFMSAALGLALGVGAAPVRADWVVPTAVDAIKPYPNLLQVQPQNPPGFSWSRYPVWPRVESYVLEIRSDTTVVATYSTKRNFYLPSKAFAPGLYTWRVRPVNNTDWSTPRSFKIDATSKVFEVPESSALLASVSALGHPRQLPRDFLPASSWSAAMSAERTPALNRLITEVASKMTMVPVYDALWSDPATYATLSGTAKNAENYDISKKVFAVTSQLESSALLYRLTGDIAYYNEAIARGDELTALSPTGPTGYTNQDQTNRQVALTLAKAADLLFQNIDASRKSAWMAAIKARTLPMYDSLSGNDGRLDQYPYDSHGAENLGYVALISALCVGDIDVAPVWFEFSLRSYVHSIYVWSGPEGGYSNGTAYGHFTTDVVSQLWTPLRMATGIDLYRKPWSDGFAKFFMYFLPPGTPSHKFGDARESFIDLASLKSFVSRFATPEAAWYVNNTAAVEWPMSLLRAEYPLPASTVAVATPPPNAALFPSIGWVAMHSSLADRARTSVYFKSSPYGSFNHSHGDQNSLVIDSGGRRLLIESGYMDYFMSPLAMSWYRQTKSHNAITFDNGVGQLIDGGLNNLTRTGKITAFSTSATLDYAEGDATPAYGGLLTSAIRKVWYMRGQDAVVVLDKLTSPVSRLFEWNMHANGTMVPEADGTVKITNIDRTLCLRSLSGVTPFVTRVGAPPKTGVVEAHGAFTANSGSKAEFLVVLDVGCKRPTMSVTTVGGVRTLTVGTRSLTLPN